MYQNLKALRESLGMTQAEFGKTLGLAKSTYSNYETGEREPKSDFWLNIASKYNVTIDYLMGFSSMSQAYSNDKNNAPVLSTEALRLAKDYEQLDRWGRRQVRCVTDNELERMREDRNFLEDAQPEEEPKIVNLFLNPSAAGPALGETGQACEPYELKPDDPQGAAYAIRVQGDSMEPDFPDGSIAFVNHDEMRDGDIGVFCVDGATVIKQWHYDRVLGMTYLFSLNRKREDCDVLITRSSGRTLVWQGRVITTRRYELPGVSDKT